MLLDIILNVNNSQLGKRVFIKQGSKNIPRLGRRSDPGEDNKNYNHVQPFDSKFIFDFLSDEILIGDGDLKFLSWEDLDKALESDSTLKQKLSSIARDKEVEELRKFAYDMNLIDDKDTSMTNKVYQKFIPYDNQRYNSNENDVYYYYAHDMKRGDKNMKTEHYPKLFMNK